MAELNDIFSAFDRIVEMFGCERIKTFGDAYLAVSGLPGGERRPCGLEIARVALRMRRYIERRNASHPTPWLCRIGINTGPVIGSIVGVQKYVYDIFGPAVNLAARLEALSEPMQITLCARHHDLDPGRLPLPAARHLRDRWASASRSCGRWSTRCARVAYPASPRLRRRASHVHDEKRGEFDGHLAP